MEFLHPAMWHVALESRQWIHQVAATCNVIRGSGMTYHWIRENVRHIKMLHLVAISTTSPQSTCHSAPKFYPNRTTLGRKKWPHVDFQDGGSQPSWILGIQQWALWIAQLHYFLLVVNRHHSSKLLRFEKIAFFLLFGDRQTDKQTNKQTNRSTASMH